MFSFFTILYIFGAYGIYRFFSKNSQDLSQNNSVAILPQTKSKSRHSNKFYALLALIGLHQKSSADGSKAYNAKGHQTNLADDSKAQIKKVNWTGLEAVGISLGLYFSSQLLAFLVLSSTLLLPGWDQTRLSDWLDSNTFGQFVTIALIEIITLGLLYNFLKRRHSGFGVLGLGRWIKLSDIGHALVGFVVYFLLFGFVSIIVTKFLPEINVNQRQQIGFQDAGGIKLVLVFISLVILPPITEEILVRGFLYSGLRNGSKKIIKNSLLDLRKARPSPDQLTSADSGLPSLDVVIATSPSVKPLSARADLPWERAILRKSSLKIKRLIGKYYPIIITSGLFAIAHLQAGSGEPLLWIAALDTFILSIVLVNLREKTGSLWSSIMLHMIKNGLAFVALFIFHIN